MSGYYDSSSPDGGASSMASKNIVSERNRRKKLNERLFALRAVVPNISKVYIYADSVDKPHLYNLLLFISLSEKVISI